MAYSPRASGLGNSAAYQVSGKPFLNTEDANVNDGAVKEIAFPTVTKQIVVVNNGATGKNVKVAFSATGITGAGGEHFLLAPVADGGQPLVLDVKCTSIFFRGSEASGTPSVSVYASLTGIPITECYDNWSGATGV